LSGYQRGFWSVAPRYPVLRRCQQLCRRGQQRWCGEGRLLSVGVTIQGP